jgi:hypothetical protein
VPQTVHNTVWFINGNNAAVPGVPPYLLDISITTNDAHVTTLGIPSPGNYKLHWNVESDSTVTIRQ